MEENNVNNEDIYGISQSSVSGTSEVSLKDLESNVLLTDDEELQIKDNDVVNWVASSMDKMNNGVSTTGINSPKSNKHHSNSDTAESEVKNSIDNLKTYNDDCQHGIGNNYAHET